MAQQLFDTIRTRTEQEPRSALRTPRPFPIVALQTTAAVVAEARPDADLMAMSLLVANVTGSGRTYTLHLVPPGGSPGTGNLIAGAVALAANSSATIDLGLNGFLVPPEHSIRGLCSENGAINIVGWGYDYQGVV